MSNADQIRQFAFKRFVAPARKRGETEITVRAGDIHRDMILVSSMPSVCSALGGKKFFQLAGVSLIERRGPPQGANVYFRFALDPLENRRQPAKPLGPGGQTEPRNHRVKNVAPRASSEAAPKQLDFRNALVLVSCVKSKLAHPAPARELYSSPLFRKMRALVENGGAPWFILSALHGLVAPDTVIAPYERTLKRQRIAERRAWADGVFASLAPHLSGTTRVIFFAGADYREFLAIKLRGRGIAVEVPMEGLAFGNQLSWLSSAE